jgi:alkylated DNA repair dioxygenase AlkB
VTRNSSIQLSLLEPEPSLPKGFCYCSELISEAEERALVVEIERLPFQEFEFHGFSGKRRVVSFGWQYSFSDAKLRKAELIPQFLLPVREKAARFAGLDAHTLDHVLVTEYSLGAAIGWHKDKAIFNEVIGVSLLSACTFRFRKKAGTGWQRASLRLQPRSAYSSGPCAHRMGAQHSRGAEATLFGDVP